MNTDTQDFLEALLWLNESQKEQDKQRREETEENGEEWDESNNDYLGDGATIYDFSPAFIDAVSGFISGFREFLELRQFDMDRLDSLSRSFGGSILFSLSGHGLGFFDESIPEDENLGLELQTLIRKYSKDRHRFEELEYSLSWHDGKIDLFFIPEALEERRKEIFERGESYSRSKVIHPLTKIS